MPIYTFSDDKLSSISIAAYFRRLDLHVISCPVRQKVNTTKDMCCPLVRCSEPHGSDEVVSFTDFWEWIGSVAVGVDW